MGSGTIKWYDPEKGYGFISPDDGGDDLFLHRSAVGLAVVNDGDRVEFEIGSGPKGAAAERLRVTEPNPAPRPRRAAFGALQPNRFNHGGSPGFAPAPISRDVETAIGEVVTGAVKRYDPVKGYGFIVRDDGGPDVFVHRSAVDGDGLTEGDRVEFRLAIGPKGTRAQSLRVTDAALVPFPR